MKIEKVTGDKKRYLDLLLLADEQEDMVDKYLERGEMFVLNDNGVKAECVITKESEGVYELKNIAVLPKYQRRGYGKVLIEFLVRNFSDCHVLYVGTGDCPSTLSFYHSCGFTESHRLKNFFTDNYDHLIFEDGIQLVDMVYLKRECQRNILVSACLLGMNCRYNGEVKENNDVVELLRQKGIHMIPVCPEQMGGLTTPRDPAEIQADGRVVTRMGNDVTLQYRRGAEEALKMAKLYHCNAAILKERSPACGHGCVYDGTFSGTLTEGDGIAAKLLMQNQMDVFGESELELLCERFLNGTSPKHSVH